MMHDIWSQIIQYISFDAGYLVRPEMLARLSLQAFLLVGSAFFSGSETALFSLSDVDLEQLRKQRNPRTDLLHDLLSQPRRLIVSILCGNELINIAATVNMTGILLVLYGSERAGVLSLIVMVPLLLLVGEITPKTIAVSYPVQVSTRIVCSPMNLWVRLITPVRWVIRMIADRITTWVVGEARDVDHILRMTEFRSLVAEIEEEGMVSATDRVLIYNLLDAGNTEVEHIMTPRTSIRFARPDMQLSEIIEMFVNHRQLRIPVFNETPDDIMGFIHAEKVVNLVKSDEGAAGVAIRDILEPALFVPLTKNTDEMLDFFQKHDERAAMVIDEFGGIAGIVTIEDVLSFIFGEIAGEFIETPYTQEDEKIFMVPGNMKLNEFEALTNFGIEDPRVTTIGGVALRHLDRLPHEGDQVSVDGIRMSVIEMKGNRIARLRAAKLESADTPGAEDDGDERKYQ